MRSNYNTIDEYIKTFPKEIQDDLESLRKTIHETAPTATEAISYQMPTFKLNGNLVHFAAFKKHIGFFPAPSGIDAFEKELKIYRTGKGTLQFPLDKPIPMELIVKIVKYRVSENEKKKSYGKK